MHADPVSGVDPNGMMLSGFIGSVISFSQNLVKSATYVTVGTTIGLGIGGGLLYHFRYGKSWVLGTKLGMQLGLSVGLINGSQGKRQLGIAMAKAGISAVSGWIVDYVIKWGLNEPWSQLEQEQKIIEGFVNSMWTQAFSWNGQEEYTFQDDDLGLKELFAVWMFSFVSAFSTELFHDEKEFAEKVISAVQSSYISTMNSQVTSTIFQQIAEPKRSLISNTLGIGHNLLVKSLKEWFTE